ncbi:hypothetical protein MCUN1_002674 [Malassezia cuniculi]|uniref:EamA domain-containing protein n=1 Tax=Malassezia cuniculi TaxID=948313 RepID=A0AAF0EW44_9BASI|nr:hypothetical protein MCUN1_002674 [Malassezia cuniculi]
MSSRGREYLGGAVLVLLVDILWTLSNYLSSAVLTHGYHKPFALTFANTASFVTYLGPFAALYALRGPQTLARADDDDEQSAKKWYERLGFRLPPRETHIHLHHDIHHDVERVGREPFRRMRPSSIDGRRPESNISVHGTVLGPPLLAPRERSVSPDSYGSIDSDVLASELPPLTLRETAVLAAQFAIVWFAANWSFIAALGFTSVASGTTLGSASGFFTLLLGSFVGTDRFSPGKLIAVTLSFVGVALVTWADAGVYFSAQSLSKALFGDLLALLSALCYAVYVTLLKARIGSEERISMPLFLGLVGAFNLLAFWPLGLILDYTGVEKLEWPSDRLMLLGVVFNMCITVVADLAYLLAMLKSSPLFTTIGLSLTIPMAALGDRISGIHNGGLQSNTGSLLVLISFAAIAWEENH